jgi:hypothetical protein
VNFWKPEKSVDLSEVKSGSDIKKGSIFEDSDRIAESRSPIFKGIKIEDYDRSDSDRGDFEFIQWGPPGKILMNEYWGEEKNSKSYSLGNNEKSSDIEVLKSEKEFSIISNKGKEIENISFIIKNKEEGLAREKEVGEELKEKYPPEEGYQILQEVYLRDKDGNIVKDPVTGEARRVDFMVVKDGKVVESIEVTSKTADKTEQTAKEERIRANGGNYVKDKDGNLVEIPADVHTQIERRD